MVGKLLGKFFKSKHERDVKKIQPLANQIMGLEDEYKALSEAELRGKTEVFRARLKAGESTDDILPEAFATIREVSSRRCQSDPEWKMVHYPVQLIGGIVLHQGKIAEMKTGEGKTLVATLAAYVNAIGGKGVYIVTVNEYLATRDCEWMAPLFEYLGMTVGVIKQGLSYAARREAYLCDVTYGTNNEFGFDYLRDNMVTRADNMVQRGYHYAIIDEVDSILVDEARTPLIISGQGEAATDLYAKIDRLIPKLRSFIEDPQKEKGKFFAMIEDGAEKLKDPDADYVLNEKDKRVTLTEVGGNKMSELLHIDNLYDDQHYELVHHINQALKAHAIFKRDRDYVVKDNQVMIVDEFTGRLLEGRRYSDGLHQALEAKEGVEIQTENQTLATITLQNFFRMFEKLSGMTGTADTEAAEFMDIYKLDVVVIPTNRPNVRADHPDQIYRTTREKFNAVIDKIVEVHAAGQPTLVGTISIEDSESLAALLKKRGIKHSVLNAKHHAREAEIVSRAGQPGAVTIATNMAGRGTDIVLGEGVEAAGGLFIMGTERHESRRIDNQLRGRCARQGDPGASIFYLSLEDDLMRLFGSDRISGMMERLGMEEGQVIEAKMVTKSIETAQKRVEGNNFEIRKHVLEYDDVMNMQRSTIYKIRDHLLKNEDISDYINRLIGEVVTQQLAGFINPAVHREEWDWEGLLSWIHDLAPGASFQLDSKNNKLDLEDYAETITAQAREFYNLRREQFGVEIMRSLEKDICLHILDSKWRDHLCSMDFMRDGVGLQGYAQKDPLTVYKKNAFDFFVSLIASINVETISYLFRIQVVKERSEQAPPVSRAPTNIRTSHQEAPAPVRHADKVGRNDPCPCGSGKKYKKCHLPLEEGVA